MRRPASALLRALLALVVVVIVVGTLFGSALSAGGQSSSATGTAKAGGTPTPAPTASPATGPQRNVTRALAAVARAFDNGNVSRLCRPGGLVDPAVITRQGGSSGCESEYESLLADGDMRLTVHAVQMRPDLATATVTTAGRASVRVDLVRNGGSWLLSFSDGDDPLQALTS
jgi:hypothetical protein